MVPMKLSHEELLVSSQAPEIVASARTRDASPDPDMIWKGNQ